MIHRPTLTACFLAGAAILNAGETITSASTSLNPMQYLGSGARPTALGSAFTAVGGDISALYFNPAGLGTLKGSHAGLHHHSWLGGINQETLSFGIGGRAFSFGLTGDLVNYGVFEGTDEFGEPLPSFTPMDLSLGLTLAKGFQSGVSIGGRIRATQQNIADAGQLSSGMDLGLIWKSPVSGFSLGMAYANFGPSVNGSAPSAAVRLGAAYDFAFGHDFGLLLMGSASGLNSGGELLQLGAEARMSKNVAARAGYQASFMDQNYGGLSGLSGGLGFMLGWLGIDYAYLPYGNAGQAHRVSLNVNFMAGASDPKTVSKAPAPGPQSVPQAQPKPVSAQAPRESLDLVFEAPVSEGAKDFDRGEAELLAAVQANPKNERAWYLLGRRYYEQKKRPQMLEAFGKLLELQPQNSELKAWLEKVK